MRINLNNLQRTTYSTDKPYTICISVEYDAWVTSQTGVVSCSFECLSVNYNFPKKISHSEAY